MRVITTKDELRALLLEWRRVGERIALVPTMGNLHAGHDSLVEIGRRHADRIVVSVFVNPVQFGEGEDFEGYPRTLERDMERLREAGADLLFVPEVDTMYPFGLEQATVVAVPYLKGKLCGSFRPGHFDGVTTVVARLFALVQPNVAVFGQKDYQQQLIIRRMVADLNLPVEIVVAPTVREKDGLALSSRNAYLSDEQRAVAPAIYKTLLAIGEKLQNGQRNYDDLEREATAGLADLGFRPDYVALRCAGDLSDPDADCDEIVVLVAAYLGDARLIDNISVAI
jgi:pantoate--beta-alanine ligase